MLRLPEDLAKAWLAEHGVSVPAHAVARTPAEARTVAERLQGPVVVKARVPAGRRGKAGLVVFADAPAGVETAAAGMLGRPALGHRVDSVLIEQRIAIDREYFLSFLLTGRGIEMLLSLAGGVDVEAAAPDDPRVPLRVGIQARHGLAPWQAIEHWHRAGARGPILRSLSAMTADLYRAFCRGDATTLEINPLAIAPDGSLHAVGTMMAVDEHALFRHPRWQSLGTNAGATDNVREAMVREASAALPGGEAQYVELDGDIGLLVGGGGAGLTVHDAIVALGGRPANHCVTPPTGTDTRKLEAVLRAILGNPRIRALLVGFNFAQMARADLRMRALARVLRESIVQVEPFPIVVRLFGAGEAEARALAAEFSNITYMPRGTSLSDAAAEIVRQTGDARRQRDGSTA